MKAKAHPHFYPSLFPVTLSSWPGSRLGPKFRDGHHHSLLDKRNQEPLKNTLAQDIRLQKKNEKNEIRTFWKEDIQDKARTLPEGLLYKRSWRRKEKYWPKWTLGGTVKGGSVRWLQGVTCRKTVGNAPWECTKRSEDWKREGEGGKINSMRSFNVLTRKYFQTEITSVTPWGLT